MYLGFKKYKRPSKKLTESVSVIVAVKNEALNIERLLASICVQNYSDYDIIIVDDHSSDNSFELLESFQKKYTNLNVFKANYPLAKSSKKMALTQAIKASRASYLLFTDADCYPSTSNWIQSMVNHTSGKDIVLGISPYEKRKGLVNAMIQFETGITYFLYASASLWGMPYMGVGRNLLVKKELLVSVNFYEKHLDTVGGDDDLTINELATSKNTRVNLSSDSVVYSQPLESYRSRFWQKIRHFSVGKYYNVTSKVFLGIINTSWIVINLLFFICLAYNINLVPIITLHILRTVLLFLIFDGLTKRSTVYSLGLKSVYLDNLYSLELLILGPLGLLSKKIVWQKKNSFQKKP